jgi:hypothetical protein
MSFSLPRFLRRTPPTTLVHYFAARGISLPPTLNWRATHRVLTALLYEAIENLDAKRHDQTVADFERPDQLCDPIGQRALLSLVASTGNTVFLARLRAADSSETRGIMVLLDDEPLFERALALAYAERLRNGRRWSAFVAPNTAQFIIGAVELTAFEDDVATILEQFDGTGGKLKIDTFQHRTYNRDVHPIGVAAHHTIYAEGMTEIELQFEGQEPRPHAKRPVHEGAITYDLDRKILDVVTRGGKSVREQVAQSYARHVLGVTGGLQSVRPQSYYLDRLKRRMPFPSDPADGLKAVNVILLRLRDTAGHAGWVTLETDNSGRVDIYDLSVRWFGDADPLGQSNWRVAEAKLRIAFHPEPGQTRDKIVTIELRAPNHSNLKEQLHHHEIISRKYLTRWGLVEQQGT